MKKAGIISAAIVVIYFIASCNSKNKNIEEGEKLAKTYCASCHQFPEPALLDKQAWVTSVLPQMAQLMYVDAYYNPYENSGPDGDKDVKRVAPENLFPVAKFKLIAEYYEQEAPEKPIKRTDSLTQVETRLKNFALHAVAGKFRSPMTMFVKIDTAAQKIFFADGAASKMYVTDNLFSIKDSFLVNKGTVDAGNTSSGMMLLSMGILSPSDAKLGKLCLYKNGVQTKVILDSLQRPVFAKYADLNGDKKEDILISEFGFRQGALSWFENSGDGKYIKHLLRSLPGAMYTDIYDFNKDGKPDIIALMAQADEGVFIYYNEGNNKFREERVASFPPIYGSSYFQLLDYNSDGYIDFITTNGDNADYSISVKAYHGIRIFLNDGHNHFAQKVFLPVNGIQKAVPSDFDNDGDIDIASISFFPDYLSMPEESFIYWENNGDNTYKRYTFEAENDGRWMTMDAGDMDGDGDKDIILGSAAFAFGNVPEKIKENWNKKKLSVYVLENTIKSKTK